MKKKFIAFILAACVGAACLPLIGGCKSNTDYTLKTDENGEKYYSVRCSGMSNSLKGEYVIPEEYGEGEDKAPVREIEQEGFSGTSLTKITIPKTVTKIGNAAFAYNNSLAEVVFDGESGLEEISRGAFGYCYGLREITLPQSVKSIGYMAFYNCTALSEITFPAGLEEIGGAAFQDCVALTGVELPDGLTTIGEVAFYGTSLNSIIIPGSLRDKVVPVLGEDGEQKKDENGNPVTETVYGLGVGAFHSCTELTLAVIEEGVKTIASGAFGYCTALKTVYLPASLEKIDGAFYRNGKFYTGHAFHSDNAITDLYYAGTQQQWAVLENNIVKEPVNVSNYKYSNDSLLSSSVVRRYEAQYNK